VSAAADVIVVGGGPAGAAAALELVRRGHAVAVLEQHSMPREKVCGDALIPDCLECLTELGLLAEVSAQEHSVDGLRLYSPAGHQVDLRGRCLTLARRELDALLLAAAAREGAQVHEGWTAVAFETDERTCSVRARCGDREAIFSAKLCILATGASSKPLRAFGVPHRAQPSALAARAYYRMRGEAPEDRLQIWYEAPVLPGYGWMFPMGGGVFNVGVGLFLDAGADKVNLRTLLDHFARDCRGVRDLIDGAEALTPLVGAPLRTALLGTTRYRDRLLVAGEAIGATYSFSGEGIGKAMETARVAASFADQALRSDRPLSEILSQYPRELESRFRERFKHYQIAQKWLRHPWAANLLAKKAVRSAEVRAVLEDVLNERRSPTDVLSLPGLLRLALFA
jgi:geranylgeranyl reductase family protein